MEKYRKRPVVIEAIQLKLDSSNINQIVAISEEFEAIRFHVGEKSGYNLLINTLEGKMTANPGDWIIKGVKGEFYPCKPDIFEKTYEKVS